jgi:sugar/nucleoside kinase (ribokinase family)
VEGVGLVHLSGITLGISDASCDAGFAAMRIAREAGALVSFDTNLRLRLWPLDRARACIHAAVANGDIVFPSLDDARLRRQDVGGAGALAGREAATGRRFRRGRFLHVGFLP